MSIGAGPIEEAYVAILPLIDTAAFSAEVETGVQTAVSRVGSKAFAPLEVQAAKAGQRAGVALDETFSKASSVLTAGAAKTGEKAGLALDASFTKAIAPLSKEADVVGAKAGAVGTGVMRGAKSGLVGLAALAGGYELVKGSIEKAQQRQLDQIRSTEVFGNRALPTVKTAVEEVSKATLQTIETTTENINVLGQSLQAVGVTQKQSLGLSAQLAARVGDVAAKTGVDVSTLIGSVQTSLASGSTRALRSLQVVADASDISFTAAKDGIVQVTGSLPQLKAAQTSVTLAQAKLNEAIDKFGPSSNQANAAQKAYNKTNAAFLADVKAQVPTLTKQQKALALTHLILDKTTSSEGAAEKRASTFNGAIQRLKVAFSNLEEEIGNKIIPILTRAADVIASFFGFLDRHTTTTHALVMALTVLASALLAYKIGTLAASAATKVAAVAQGIYKAAIFATTLATGAETRAVEGQVAAIEALAIRQKVAAIGAKALAFATSPAGIAIGITAVATVGLVKVLGHFSAEATKAGTALANDFIRNLDLSNTSLTTVESNVRALTAAAAAVKTPSSVNLNPFNDDLSKYVAQVGTLVRARATEQAAAKAIQTNEAALGKTYGLSAAAVERLAKKNGIDLTKSYSDVSQAVSSVLSPTKSLTSEDKAFTAAQKGSQVAVDALTQALDTQLGTFLDLKDAEIAARNDFHSLKTAVDASNGSFSILTQKGRDAHSALDQFVRDTINTASAAEKAGKSTRKIGDGIRFTIDKLKSLPGSSAATRQALAKLRALLDNVATSAHNAGSQISHVGTATVANRGSGPSQTHFAKGGVVDRATLALIGEAGREVVIPMTNHRRALQLARQSGLLDLLVAQSNHESRGSLASVTTDRSHTRTTTNHNTFVLPAVDPNQHAQMVAHRLAVWSDR